MEELAKNLSGVWYIATCEDGQPHVRPFHQAAVKNDHLYIGTNRGKKVFEQILKNPKIEIYAPTDFGPCRLMAEAYEETDEKTAEEALIKMGKSYEPGNSVALRLENIQKY